ncbi:hypothetical protein LTR87_013032 [Friedmanniomyces endolithicus]|nr:hypothetical protein LTR87_013032 [Friedmanniomyces endolithicus]
MHGSQAVSAADVASLGSTEQAESDANRRLPLLRTQSSPSQSGITFTLSGSLYGTPPVREDGEECFERRRHAVLAASHLASYGDDTSSENEDIPLQSSEANIEEAVATSIEHQETSSPDQQGTGSGTNGTYRVSGERRPEDSVVEVDHVETIANKAGEAEEKGQSVNAFEEDDRAECNEQAEQAEHTHQAATGREKHSRDNIGADEGAEGDAEADGNALPRAAAKESGRAGTEKDCTSQTPAPERHYTSSGSTRVSDRVMLPSQSGTALTGETPSPDAHIVPRQKATGSAGSAEPETEKEEGMIAKADPTTLRKNLNGRRA